jgi:LPXTG-motif cell wall-anchored protein
MKKYFRALLVLILAGSLVTTPAYSAPTPFGPLLTINPTGGTSTTDGLKIDVASGQLQITRQGTTQLYGVLTPPLPDPQYSTAMYNYFSVVFTASGLNKVIDSYIEDYSWESGTSSANLAADGRSGEVTNVLTSSAIPGFADPVVLTTTFSYTYPNQYLTVSTALALPPGWNYPTRVYWNADATLGGADDGNQFEGVSSSGQQLRGVVNPNGTTIQGFRQAPGQSLFSWAGYLDCPWGSYADCAPLTPRWLANNLDAPNAISTGTNIDNGYGVSVPVVSTAGIHRASFDLVFVDCGLNSSYSTAQLISCIDTKAPRPSGGGGSDRRNGDEAIEEVVAPEPALPTLAATGLSTAVPIIVGLGLVMAGLGSVLLARRRP